jgi:hypothetical protein
LSRDDHFRFGSVFIKKNNQTEIYFFKKKPKPVQTDRFRFCFGQKPVQTGLAWFFRFGSVFLVLARFDIFFSGLARFFLFQFGFFGFMLIKPKSNRTGRFFKILIGFFHGSVFSVISFPVFSVFFSPLVLSQLLLLFFRAHWHFLALVYLKVICEIALHSWMMICVSRS